ncbi:hypothetical protein [Neobacillus cucumis]|uniref:hypothetical protein n=1 Tax=Neobacillus cucumis TaxID=1740721 RepID=UPI0028535936|nr:hypothetical protein [Neobacillus cucumis]MDR4947372.1 hypothetical protein [Neobacillus cucumis]
MRKTFCLVFLFMFILAGCNSFHQNAIIDWVDFVKWDGIEYDGIYNGVLADESYINKKIGEVKFKVADNVSDPEYKLKNGDAAFHKKGTPIYSIKDNTDIIAVKSTLAINGYSVYFSREGQKKHWRFQDMPIDQVNKMEIYLVQPSNTRKLLSQIKSSDQINRFIQILKNSKDSPHFQPNVEKGDPLYYQIVFYTGEPIAYLQSLQFDGTTYYWFPDDTAVLSNEIQEFLPK